MFIYTAMPHLLLAGCTTRLSPTPFTAVHDQSPFLLPVLTYAFPRINSAEMSMAGAQALQPLLVPCPLGRRPVPVPSSQCNSPPVRGTDCKARRTKGKGTVTALPDGHSFTAMWDGAEQRMGAAEPLGFIAKPAGR